MHQSICILTMNLSFMWYLIIDPPGPTPCFLWDFYSIGDLFYRSNCLDSMLSVDVFSSMFVSLSPVLVSFECIEYLS